MCGKIDKSAATRRGVANNDQEDAFLCEHYNFHIKISDYAFALITKMCGKIDKSAATRRGVANNDQEDAFLCEHYNFHIKISDYAFALALGRIRTRERRKRQQVQNESKREMKSSTCTIVRMYINMCV